MSIKLHTLEHQQRALAALTHVFDGVVFEAPPIPEANPVFNVENPTIHQNISDLQSGAVEGIDPIPRAWRGRTDDGVLGIDVKMETGAGKTLVYTQLMYEMSRLYGFTKFIILVPSTPIKEGTRSFITSNYAKQYFDDTYYGRQNLHLNVLDPQKRSRGRKMFPSAITNFVQSSRLASGRLSALLMTDGMLLSKATMSTTYDQMTLGVTSQPYEALRQTRPVVIIDEPHRFRRENKAYQALLEHIKPQAIIRFGATFPKLERSGRTDYNNLIFNLGAVEAFNNQLVKGVGIQYPQDSGSETTRLRVTSLSARKPKQATFKNLDTGKSLTLGLGDSLAEADGDFVGINVDAIGKTESPHIKSGITLSNGQILARGDTIAARVYSDTYQGLMMSRALENHFEIEWDNFCRGTKIKTLSLFFIDSVESYRGKENDGHLRVRFEELLTEKLKKEIDLRSQENSVVAREYVSYLRASLADVKATNGGYFSADNSTSDAAIQSEVDQILRDKQKLLSFTHSDGTPNTMRFIFSKWTLREGWDNPNVFQIVKLRSSGSEISKLQEVGRGVRLPVDSDGDRMADEQFYLTYLVDHTEQEFADSLLAEVNSEVLTAAESVKELLPKVAKARDMDETELFIELMQKGLVDSDKNLIEGKEAELYELYPEFSQGKVRPDKILNNKPKAKIRVRPERYSELKELWEVVNSKYYLSLDQLTEEEIEKCIDFVLSEDIYRTELGRFTQDTMVAGDGGTLTTHTETKDTFEATQVLPYGQWLKLAYQQTYLPPAHINAGLIRRDRIKPLPEDFFNKATLGRFTQRFAEWMQREYINRFSYTRIKTPLGATALTDANGRPLEYVVQGNLGIHRDSTTLVSDKFLYDAYVYDSPKELSTLRESNLDEVVVYGKIPRRSIRVPVYFGGTTSPDFMYVLKSRGGNLSLNFVVETKDVNTSTEMRELEQFRIEAAKEFFSSVNRENITVQFASQLKHDDIVTLIQRVLG